MSGSNEPTTAELLTDCSRKAQGTKVHPESMNRTDRILLGTLMRIAQGVEELIDIEKENKVSIKSEPQPVTLADAPATGDSEIARECVGALMLGTRINNALTDSGVTTVLKLTQCTERKLLRIPGLALTSIREIRQALDKRGLTFSNSVLAAGTDSR